MVTALSRMTSTVRPPSITIDVLRRRTNLPESEAVAITFHYRENLAFLRNEGEGAAMSLPHELEGAVLQLFLSTKEQQ
jgi:hypothetical protein